MYQFSYAEVLEGGSDGARQRDGQALDRSLELLRAAEAAGPGTREGAEAIYFASRLWTALIEDLGQAENDLPKELRAGLISIGIWIMKEGERIRLGLSDNFRGIIEISSMVREGLR